MTSYLLRWPPQALSYVYYHTLSDHHALRPSKAPEGRVRRQVGAAHESAAAHVRHAVGVFHVEQGALQDLDKSSVQHVISKHFNKNML